MKTRWTAAWVAAVVLVAAGSARAAPWCVDADAMSGIGDGTCWDAPFARIQDAVDAAAAAGGGEVWVKEGTYYENLAVIAEAVAVYGGFAGGETALAQRDHAAHATVIDGGRVGTAVVISGGAGTRLDGFTVRNGYAGRDQWPGGGLKAGGAVTVANNWITRNSSVGWGGGVVTLEAGSPLITGNLIENNTASFGGGIWDVMSGTRIVGNVIRDNRPSGIAIWASSPTVANNVVLGNTLAQVDPNSTSHAGAIVNNLVDCLYVTQSFVGTVANNVVRCSSAPSAAALPGTTYRNNAFWNRGYAVTGLVPGDGNFLLDCGVSSVVVPGGFHLPPGSPCLDLGDATVLPALLTTDLDGEPRVLGAGVDLGPDEAGTPHTILQAAGTPGASGWFRSDVTVALAAGPAGGVSAVELTTDGGATWSAYGGPFTHSAEGVPLRVGYRSVAMDGTVEPAKEALLRIDRTPPTASAAAEGHRIGEFFDVPPTVRVTAADAEPGSGLDEVTLLTDGCGLARTTYRDPFSWSCDGDPAILRYETRDRAGNVVTATLEARVDAVPPTTAIAFSSYGWNGWAATDVTATVSAYNPGSGVASREWAVAGGPWQPYSDASPILLAEEGRHVVRARAWDNLGRVGPEVSAEVGVDETPPVTTADLAGTGADGCWRSDVDVVVTATDALSGIHHTEYSVDGGTTWSWTYSGMPNRVATEGTTRFLHRALDWAQNMSPPVPVDVSIDRTAPISTATATPAAGASGWITAPVSVALDAADAGCGVRALSYRIDGGAWQVYAGTPVPIVAQGAASLSYRAEDVPGNLEIERTLDLSIDTVPPICSATASGTPGTPPWWVSPVAVTFASSDAAPGSGVASTEVSFDGGPWAGYAGPLAVGVEGAHSVRCRATDAAGLSALSQLEALVDLAPPATTAVIAGTPGENGFLVSPATVTLSALDAASGVASTEWSADGLLWLAYAAPVVFGDGCHAVSFRSTDAAGWGEVAPPPATFCVDATAPAVASTIPAAGASAVPIATPITVVFAEAVRAGPAFASVTVTSRYGRRDTPVAYVATISGAALTLQPTDPLPRMASVTVDLPAGALKDVAGSPSAPHAFAFTTTSR